jgi:serine phosphatase RsbU (regulator of sigma subunit)
VTVDVMGVIAVIAIGYGFFMMFIVRQGLRQVRADAGERYRVGHAEIDPGDVLAVLTDGLTETMDLKDRELGLGPIEAVLAAHAAAPLPELYERLLEVARAHGPQQDDRTLLLVRSR